MKFNAFGKIFSIIAMLTLVFALTFAISVTANAEEPEQNEPTIIITATPAEDFKTVTFTWEAITGARYCVYVNDVHVAVVREPSYTLEMKIDEVVDIFIDAINANDETLMTGSLDYKHHKLATKETDKVAPTCLAAGSYTEVTYCSSCKEELSKVENIVIEKLEHEYKDTVKEPTCTKDGYTVTTCPNGCGYTSEEKDIVAAPGHAWDNGTVTPPTCTENGYTTFACANCSKTKTENVTDATGHTWKDATCDAPKTCTVCSETEGQAAGHKFAADTNEKAFIVKEVCEDCGEVGEFLKVQLPPAYKDTVVKVVVVIFCAIVIILSIKGLMAPPTTTPWYKRRKHRR